MQTSAELPASRPAIALFLLLTLLLTPALAHAQLPPRPQPSHDPDYIIHTWETEHGLPENSATAMAQTPDGYLWFGTFNGLIRFDGVRFETFNPRNLPELPAAAVVNLHLDRSQRLWVSTLQGMAVRERGTWRTLGPADGWTDAYARSFAERPNGDLLVTTFDRRLFQFADGRFSQLPPPHQPPEGDYLAAADAHGRWWVVGGSLAEDNRINVWNGSAWTTTTITITPPSTTDIVCAPSRDGGVWILTGSDLSKHTPDATVLRRTLPEPIHNLWSLFEDSLANLWITTSDRGVYRLSPDGHLRHWHENAGLSYNGVRFTFEDREGNIWIGTSGGGLSRFKQRRINIIGPDAGLHGRVVNSVSADHNGNVFIATYDKGLFRFDGLKATPIMLDTGHGNAVYIQSVLHDRAGRTWVGSFARGLYIIEGDSARSIPPEHTGGNNIIALFEDSAARVWVSGGNGVAVFDRAQSTVYNQPGAPSLSGVSAFAQDNQGRIWATNKAGVFRLEHDRFTEILGPLNAPIEEIFCFYAEPNGDIWMGSDAGLIRWRNGHMVNIHEHLGIDNLAVHAIIDDDRGYAWLATNRGILRAPLAQLHLAADGTLARVRTQLLGIEDGLASVDCSSNRQPLVSKDHNGNLWFATPKGVATIDPARFRENATPPSVRIETLLHAGPARSNEHTDAQGIDLSAFHAVPTPFEQPIVLPPGTRRVQLAYTAMSFTDPARVRFEVTLEGRDTTWLDAGDRRSASYNDLAPGAYVFRARAANNDGLWNESGDSLAFRIEPFLWQTAAFRAALAVVLVLAGAAAVAWWTRARRARAKDHLELRQQRSELAHLSRVNMLGELSASMAHELNQPLTAILSNAQAAQRFLEHQPLDMNELRDILGDIVEQDKRAGEIIHGLRTLLKKGEIEQSALDIVEVVHDALKMVRSDLINHGVTLYTDLDTNLPNVRGDRVQIQQVLLNIIINACDAMADIPPFARRLTLTVRDDTDNTIRISVSDAGAGISQEHLNLLFKPFFTTKKTGMGLGLSVCKTIITAHGGELWAANNHERGAVFHFTLPMYKAPPP